MRTHHYWIVALPTIGLVSVQSVWFLLLEYNYFQPWHGYLLTVLLLALLAAQLYWLRSITQPVAWGLLLLVGLIILPFILVKPRAVCTIVPGLHVTSITLSEDYSILSPEYWSAPDLCAELRHPKSYPFPS
ncbi:MAG: hypothetical protein HY565_00580 [Candidatus Kerfeldbacteria bacterium]|nr:hypothetical protein [Candidatus Kerfeldbacteria bacterium]